MIVLQILGCAVMAFMMFVISVVAIAPFVLTGELSRMERSEGRWNEEVPE
jgi:hypothetical protein